METTNTPVSHPDVERKLRELYSHLMNGVNLRYKEIEDPNITIIVIPHKFYIFKKFEDFSLSNSRVAFVDGMIRVNAVRYLYDLALWTRKFSESSDHVMLFSRHEMYYGKPDKRVFDAILGVFVKNCYHILKDYLSL
ncbi:hypothetical protein CHS0354_020222 [Potamilus streckersoni]|uniref:Uncharacterized protein n=1 Tax=Potamilus streckersoni TaxID=2493646 RepID=A0AAE0SKC7_9BIVA|nr:hypothetical protein CHS0354_020222 [Potamilus streckersoni]